MTVSLLKLIN